MDLEILVHDTHRSTTQLATIVQSRLATWLQLRAPGQDAPVAQVWLYNRIPAPPGSEVPASDLMAHAEPQAYVTDGALLMLPRRADLKLVWAPNGQAVAMTDHEQTLGFVRADHVRGWSRFLRCACAWGYPTISACSPSPLPRGVPDD